MGKVASFAIEQVPSLVGKTVLVTGGNTGIGYAAAEAFVARGASVIIAGRDAAKVTEAATKLSHGTTGEIVDLASLTSIDAFVSKLRRERTSIDVLVDNAGVFVPPHRKTADGFEVTLGVNVIGTAHLTHGLLPLVAASASGRIVVLSSDMVKMVPAADLEKRLADVGGRTATESTMAMYSQSKALNTLYAAALQARCSASQSAKHVVVSR